MDLIPIHVRLSDDAVKPLLSGLVDEYRSRFGSGHDEAIEDIENFEPPARDFDPPGGAFVVLVDEGCTLSGGGIRRLDADSCELKRMWTAPTHRGRGFASSILETLESIAAQRGYRFIRLETSPVQVEALSFYRRRGYREIPPYGPYAVAIAFEPTLGPG